VAVEITLAKPPRSSATRTGTVAVTCFCRRCSSVRSSQLKEVSGGPQRCGAWPGHAQEAKFSRARARRAPCLNRDQPRPCRRRCCLHVRGGLARTLLSLGPRTPLATRCRLSLCGCRRLCTASSPRRPQDAGLLVLAWSATCSPDPVCEEGPRSAVVVSSHLPRPPPRKSRSSRHRPEARHYKLVPTH